MDKQKVIEMVLGIVLIACSVLVFNQPILAFTALSYLLGIVLIGKGIHFIYMYFKMRSIVAFKANTFLVFGILLCLVGIIFIIKPSFTNNVFAFIFAIWFIFDAVNNTFSLGILKRLSIGLYVIGILADLILLIAAVCILINPWVAAISVEFFIGLSFLVSGIQYLIYGVTGRGISKKKTFRELR